MPHTAMHESLASVAKILHSIELRSILLEEDARASDRSGAIAPAVTETIRKAGGYRLASGSGAGVGALVRLGAGIAKHHPAAAWNCIVSNTNALLGRQFAERSGAGLPGDPDAQWCGVFASFRASAERHPEGGHAVTGAWPYASNSAIAEWALINVAHEELGPAFALVPREQLESQRDWAAIGLRGTGSHTLTAEGLRVPDARLLTAGALYREDPSGPFGLRVPSRLRTAFGLAAVAAGTGAALLTAVAASVAEAPDSGRAGEAPARMPGMPGRGVDRPGFALAIGDAASRIRGARTLLLEAGDELDAAAATGAPLAPQLLSEARLALGRVARDVADAAHELSLVAGSRACLEGNDVGRLWRDAHIAARHAALSPAIGFDLGGRTIVDPSSSDAAAAAGPLAPGRSPGEPDPRGLPGESGSR